MTNYCSLDVPVQSGPSRNTSRIDTIVLHHTTIESPGDSIGMLRLRGLSYHYLIGQAGSIVELVPPSKTAYHAAGANQTTIGIAFAGGKDEKWKPTAAQWASVKILVADLKKKYPRVQNLIGHGDVRDINFGEPYNVNFSQLIEQLAREHNVKLVHPNKEMEPLNTYRKIALDLLERSNAQKTPGQVPTYYTKRLRKTETGSCSQSGRFSFPVSLNPNRFRSR